MNSKGVAVCFLSFGLLAAGVARTAEMADIQWKAANLSGDFADTGNWNMPEGATSIAYDPSTEYSLTFFSNYGPKTLNLTLGQDLWINRIYFQWEQATYNFDLGGHALRVFGRDLPPFYNHKGWLSQKLYMSNGTLDFDGANRKSIAVNGYAGSDARYVFFGTEENPFVVANAAGLVLSAVDGAGLYFSNVVFSAGAPKPSPTGDGMVVLYNSVFPTGTFQGTGKGLVRYAGSKTSIRQANSLFGITTGNGLTWEIADGATADVANADDKTVVAVGISGSNNTLSVLGEGTHLYSTNSYGASYSGVSDITVGKLGDGNTLHVGEGAAVTLTSGILVGDSLWDVDRGPACNNRILIDGGASVTASTIILGQAANRGGWTYDREGLYTNNLCEISGGAQVQLTYTTGGLVVGGEPHVDHSKFRISDGAVVRQGLSKIGLYGVSNALEVVSGGVLTTTERSYDRGLYIGGTDSTGSVVSVSGGVLALTNVMVRMSGASADSITRFAVTEKGVVRSAYFEPVGVNNLVEIDDGQLIIGTGASFPFDSTAGDRVDIRFDGANPVLKHLGLDVVGQETPALAFDAGAKLSFVVPANGFAEAPIQGAIGIRIPSAPELSVDMTEFEGEQVLMDAGEGQKISISDSTLQAMRASLAATSPNVRIKIRENGRKLTAYTPKGMMLILR